MKNVYQLYDDFLYTYMYVCVCVCLCVFI